MTLSKKYLIGIAVLLSIQTLSASDIKVSSQSIKQNGKIGNEQVFSGFGCNGFNLSPDLSWSGAPKETKYFAITVYDLDAPTGSGWWHLTVFNIPSDVKTIPAKAGNDPTLTT